MPRNPKIDPQPKDRLQLKSMVITVTGRNTDAEEDFVLYECAVGNTTIPNRCTIAKWTENQSIQRSVVMHTAVLVGSEWN